MPDANAGQSCIAALSDFWFTKILQKSLQIKFKVAIKNLKTTNPLDKEKANWLNVSTC